MAKQNTSEHQPKRRSHGWIVLLVIVLLLGGAAGYLYYSVVKAPLETDDPQLLAASAPMSPEDRFRFFPADRTAQVRMDKSDIWSLILEHAGKDFLDTVNKELSPYGLTVSGCAIRLEEAGLWLDLELYYKETRLVARVPCALEFSENRLSLTPTGVKLGVISLPVEKLLSKVKLEYDVALPVLSEVTQVSFVQGAAVITGPVEQDIRSLVPVDKALYQTAVFCQELQYIADVLPAQEGVGLLLNPLEQDPGKVEDLYFDLFVMADPKVTEDYLDSRYGLTERFFPGIDFDAVTQEHDAMTELRGERTLILEKFFTNLVGNYNEKAFSLSDGQFLLKRKPFLAAEYGEGMYDALYETLDPNAIFLILVDAEDGFIRNTSSFYRMADENQQFTQEVNFDRTYILGCVLRSVDGDPFVMYEAEIRATGNTYSRDIVLKPLTEDAVSQLQVPGKFGVWTG